MSWQPHPSWAPNQNIRAVRQVREVRLDDLDIYMTTGNWWVLNYYATEPRPCSCSKARQGACECDPMPSPVFVLGSTSRDA